MQAFGIRYGCGLGTTGRSFKPVDVQSGIETNRDIVVAGTGMGVPLPSLEPMPRPGMSNRHD